MDWVAMILGFSGKVEVSAPGKTLETVKKGQHLSVGCRMETGANGKAELTLRNGGKLTIQPNSVVLFGSSRPESKLSLSLEQGSVLGVGSKVKSSELMIMVGGKKVRLVSEASARVEIPVQDGKANIEVSYGNALVEGPGGEIQTLVAGSTLVITSKKPDAGPPAEPDAGAAAPDAAAAPASKSFFLQSVGRGKVRVKLPGKRRFKTARRKRWMEVPPGTEIRLLRRAQMFFGPEKGKGNKYTGPGRLLVTEGGTDGMQSSGNLRHMQGEIKLTGRGKAGKTSAPYQIDGVTIIPRVSYRRVDIRIRRKGDQSLVVVNAGAAKLIAKDRTVEMEAGQDATIKKGTITGPRTRPAAPFQVRQFGTIRVFVGDRVMPVTFFWPEEAGSLVQVSRLRSMARPIFSDVISRNQLTIPGVARGSLHWRVGKTNRGRVILLPDTSYRVLKNYRAPHTTIHHNYGNTTVYYQNRLPSFDFKWNPVPGARRYHLKIFKESNLGTPTASVKTAKLMVKLRPGKLKEGTFLWYVVARGPDGSMVKSMKSHKISVKYDNATPALQIVSPRNGSRAVGGVVEARGVTIPGTKVSINGVAATLDSASRFSQKVTVKAGVSYVKFKVEVPRRGTSYYLRRVIR